MMVVPVAPTYPLRWIASRNGKQEYITLGFILFIYLFYFIVNDSSTTMEVPNLFYKTASALLNVSNQQQLITLKS